MGKPYPEDCPKCGKFNTSKFKYTAEDKPSPPPPKNFETKRSKPSDRLAGVTAIKRRKKISPDDEFIEMGEGEYFKFCGVTSNDRVPLFRSNSRFEFLLELTNNLDFIATSIF